MDKKSFNKITKETFIEYGFIKQKERFLLVLDQITVVVKFRSWRGVKSFDFFLFINDLYDPTKDMDSQIGSFYETKMEHTPTAQGYHRHEILFEQWDESEFQELLTRMLHFYFDPYKENALHFLKSNDYIGLSENAKNYLEQITPNQASEK